VSGAPAAGASSVTGNKKIIKAKLLLGEGKDEVAFFEALLKHLGKTDVQALDYGGKPKLKGFLQALVLDPKWPEVEALLITRDADFTPEGALITAPRSTWLSVTDLLRSLGLPAPTAHGELTAGVDGDAGAALRTGVFILPDGKRDGMLEDLCLDASAADSALPCLDAYFHCLGAKGITPPSNLMPKARAHAYLASRPKPDRRVGEAALEGYWPWGAAAFAPLLAFVRSA
jgi:uncharacterized protein DUF3226